MENIDKKRKVQQVIVSTYERNMFKRYALDKLDLLIEAELKRLYGISSDKPCFEHFQLNLGNGYFSQEELKEIKSNIKMFNKLSSSNKKQQEEAINYLEIALKIRAIECPWKTIK